MKIIYLDLEREREREREREIRLIYFLSRIFYALTTISFSKLKINCKRITSISLEVREINILYNKKSFFVLL